MHYKRGEFTNNHIHVTKYADDELWGSGEHMWQSRGGRGGCNAWANRGRQLEDDSVLWLTLGFTHATRAEDWCGLPFSCAHLLPGANTCICRPQARHALRSFPHALQARWLL